MKKDRKTERMTEETVCRKTQNNRFLLIFVCIFISIVIVFGVTFGIIIAVRDANATVRYEGVVLDEKTTRYFVSYYKNRYIASLSASGVANACDSPAFWEDKTEEGISYGELLTKNTEAYLRQLVCANYLFDNYSSFSANDKARVDRALEELLQYRADGSVDKLNDQLLHFGFDYDTVKKAAKILYKAASARDIVYGADGKGVKNDPQLCEKYLEEYTHVYIILIRTETKYLVDENGKYLDTVPLSESEKAERSSRIEEISSYISALDEGGDVQMSPALFKDFISKYDDFDKTLGEHGYYFHPSSRDTALFEENLYPEIVKTAYSTDIGDYAMITTDIGVWFIHRAEVQAAAYTISSLSNCFADFYSDAATYSFDIVLSELGKDVVFTEKYSLIDPVSVPYNYMYVPKF